MILVRLDNTEDISLFYKNSIYYDKIYYRDSYIYLVTSTSNIDMLSKFYKSFKVIRYYGIKGVYFFIRKHYILILSFIFTYIVLFILSNVIFSIDIITDNSKLKDNISYYLDINGIKKYKFFKSNRELIKIKDSILEENKSSLEWIEITRVGTKYIVNLTPRVINDIEIDDTKYNIVSKKDALVKYITSYKGTILKEVNELVKKGDVLISGNIYKNELVIDTVGASGSVYGEVWYTVNISVPYKHIEYSKTNEVINHIYLEMFNKKFTLIGYYKGNNYIYDRKLILDKAYLPFKVYKESKELYTYKEVNLSKIEAYNECLERADKSILNKLSKNEYIIERKVLKKNEYSSKIELELFYRVYEDIALKEEITS